MFCLLEGFQINWLLHEVLEGQMDFRLSGCSAMRKRFCLPTEGGILHGNLATANKAQQQEIQTQRLGRQSEVEFFTAEGVSDFGVDC